ncbi:MAG: hypothetical protein ABIR15_18730 [Chitinophagaceae bacterium]
MPVKKKKAAAKVKKAAPKKAAPVKTKSTKSKPVNKGLFPLPVKKANTIYIESTAFFPPSSADGYVDLFQDGRRTAVAGKSLSTAIVLPVGAVLKSISIHYKNTTPNTVLSFFLRKHADRHSPSGEIEMSFINLPPTSLPPDNYLTVTDTSFPDGGVIQDRFLHYIEIPGTGDFGAGGLFTVRGVSLVYTY